STAFLIKIKLRHSLGRPSRSDFVQSGTVTVSEDSLNGRLVYKLKPDYTLVSMICYVKTGDKYSTVKNIKSGKKLPQGTYGIFMQIKSKKNNKFYNVRLYTE
ncbi:hypothetical protein ACR0SW_20150, partial [Blautia wexlerae]|uniref:hypothetical protein n=1 Tax=Blautia wexlerae TaxID=418240 RepID=UPI003D96F906